MPTLLHVTSSPLYGHSISRQLSDTFVTQWKASHPGHSVIERDLNGTALPVIGAEWIGAIFTPGRLPLARAETTPLAIGSPALRA